MVIIVTAAVVFRPPTRDDWLYGSLLEFMGLAIVFQTFCGYNNIFERLADYYFQFAVIFIPMVFDRRSYEKSRISWRLLYAADSLGPYVFCVFGIWRFLNVANGDAHLSPYRFFFQ